MTSLNQFSFSKYGDEDFQSVKSNNHEYPYNDEGVIFCDYNLTDIVIHDAQQAKLQDYWDQFIAKYNQATGTEYTIQVIPNYYGSVFVQIGNGDIQAIADFITDTICYGEENVCYNKFMPNEYEDFIMAHNQLQDWDSMSQHDRDEGLEIVKHCETLMGYELSTDEEYCEKYGWVL